MSRKYFPVAFGLLLLALVLGGCGEERPPNIILITLDAFRADSLEAYGGNPNLTPNLNGLAARGVVFERAYTPMGTTWPAHASMLTGLYPRVHGVRRNGHVLSKEFVSAAELLSDAGYDTGSFVSYPQMHFVGKLGQGFETLSDRRRGDFEGHSRDGSETTAMTVAWLNELSGSEAPFFLWYHLFDAHGPYRINDWSRQRLGDYGGLLKEGATMDLLLKHTAEITNSEADRRALRILYEGEVRKTDGHVGELLNALRALGELDSTVFVVTADHGQAIGEQGRTGHGPVLWESVLRVPLMIVDMRRQDPVRVETTVGLVDLAPTLLALGNIDSGPSTQGRSLLPAFEGKGLEERPYYAEVSLRQDAGDWYDPNRIAVYDSGFKLVHEPGKSRLFDLKGNGDQPRPVQLSSQPAIADYLSGLAQDYLTLETQSQEAELTEEDLETLRSLGYIQ